MTILPKPRRDGAGVTCILAPRAPTLLTRLVSLRPSQLATSFIVDSRRCFWLCTACSSSLSFGHTSIMTIRICRPFAGGATVSDGAKQVSDGDDVRELLQVLMHIFEMARRLPPGAERVAALEQIREFQARLDSILLKRAG